mmetsp:Transcript_9967/g.22243  ORF Transcript_9967/g.22243 Transcript_9967/m.22243 type:complete len:229 (+) Transcript_9967:258-944(+)
MPCPVACTSPPVASKLRSLGRRTRHRLREPVAPRGLLAAPGKSPRCGSGRKRLQPWKRWRQKEAPDPWWARTPLSGLASGLQRRSLLDGAPRRPSLGLAQCSDDLPRPVASPVSRWVRHCLHAESEPADRDFLTEDTALCGEVPHRPTWLTLLPGTRLPARLRMARELFGERWKSSAMRTSVCRISCPKPRASLSCCRSRRKRRGQSATRSSVALQVFSSRRSSSSGS